MTRTELENRVMLGEDSKNQFKSDIKSPEQLAAEMVAFSNSNGSIIYVGVTDDGQVNPLDAHAVRRLNQMILHGNTNIRNPIIASFVARGLLPYHGLGSGIARARDLYPQIEFTDDRDGCQFRALVRRPGIKTPPTAGAPKLTARQAQVRSLIAKDCRITIRKLAQRLGIHTSAVQAHIEALRRKGVLDRTGGTHGRWVVGE